MQRKTIRFLGTLLLSLSLLCSSLTLSACAQNTVAVANEERILQSSADAIDAALRTEIEAKAEELEAAAAEYEASGEVLKDTSGNDIDMRAYIADLRSTAASLRGMTYIAYELAILDDLYARSYIGVYRSVIDMIPTMVDILANYGNFEYITDAIIATEALLQSYTLATEDPFDAYVDRESARAEEESPVTYVGIGVVVIQRTDGHVDIVSVTENSPAASGGVMPGDILTHLNGEDIATIEYNDVLSRVRGEAGTTVELTFLRDGTPYTVTLTRAVVPNLTVSYKMLTTGNGKTGYLRISQFSEGTFTEFVTAIEALEAMGAENFVFDVRNNPGGQIDAILGVLEYILPETDLPLVRLDYKDEPEIFYSVEEYLSSRGADDKTLASYLPAQNHELSGRIAVLCNEFTTSAGELFAACLMDFERAEVYGVTTYGKGIGQSGARITDFYAYLDNYMQTGYFPADDSIIYVQNSYLLVPSFYYSPPISENYHGVGVVPHHTITLSEEAEGYYIQLLPEELDAQLQAAIAFVEGDDPVSPPTAAPGDAGGNASGNHGAGSQNNGNTNNGLVGANKISGTDIAILVVLGALTVTAIVFAVYFFVNRPPRDGSDNEK